MASGRVTMTITKPNGDEINLSSPSTEGSAFEVLAETMPLDLGDPMHEKYIDQLVFAVTDKGMLTGLTVEVGFADRMNDTFEWLGPFSLNNMDEALHDIRFTSRYMILRIRDTEPMVLWRMVEIDIFGEVIGGRQ